MQPPSASFEAAPEPAYELANPTGDPGIIILCDHASNMLPPEYGTLGLAPDQFVRHIAYDIGAAGTARKLAALLDCPAVISRYSRLLIDLNRDVEDPTLVMKLSDGAIIPGNRDVDEFQNREELALRIGRFYAPYHEAIAGLIEASMARNKPPALISMHSFTPNWRGFMRPWSVGILWDRDDRLAAPLLAGLRHDPKIEVGDNEPYTGRLKGDCLYRHGTRNGLPHVLVELRQDLIADEAGQDRWSNKLGSLIQPIMQSPSLHQVKHYGSHMD